MQATVATTALNIRSLPNISGRILGVLTEGTIVNTLGKNNDWYEISHNDTIGFVYGAYLEEISTGVRLNGVVSTSLLNVRESPSSASRKLGTVALGQVVNIRSQDTGWLEIEFNNGLAYVSSQYVVQLSPLPGYSATANTGLLNVRMAPTTSAPVIGQLTEGELIQVEAVYDEWAQFMFGGSKAYVSNHYLQSSTSDSDTVIPSGIEEEHEPVTTDDSPSLSLAPTALLPISSDSTQRKVARTWNSYGAFLQTLSDKRGIDVACAVAVLCVESSGKGFEQNNQDRMIIRFENHKFWKYWGKNNPAAFREHFQYSSDKIWTGHLWRPETSQEWRKFHGNQAKEWEVFDFARNTDSDAAMLSISMGAPQIMGFHFERIGYQSVAEMFDAFSTDIRAQINGLFDFCSPAMISKLQSLDFVGFAKSYNGNGQKEKYGGWIKDHYDTFKQLHKYS